jgi:uncharacterized Zn-binding protein involved in type VI secretion
MAAFSRTVMLAAATLALASAAHATEPATPAASGGSPDVIVNGKPAERAGDRVGANGAPAESSPNVFINGKPAAIGGACPDGTSSASPNVFINGKPTSIGCR